MRITNETAGGGLVGVLRASPKCLEVTGEETSEHLDIVPAKSCVLHHRRLKYACPCCRQRVVTAPMPAQPILKSQASAGMLALDATAKFVDGMPLYLQSTQQVERIDFDAPRQTLARWMMQCGSLVKLSVHLKQCNYSGQDAAALIKDI